MLNIFPPTKATKKVTLFKCLFCWCFADLTKCCIQSNTQQTAQKKDVTGSLGKYHRGDIYIHWNSESQHEHPVKRELTSPTWGRYTERNPNGKSPSFLVNTIQNGGFSHGEMSGLLDVTFKKIAWKNNISLYRWWLNQPILKNMRKSNWIMKPQQIEVNIPKMLFCCHQPDHLLVAQRGVASNHLDRIPNQFCPP